MGSIEEKFSAMRVAERHVAEEKKRDEAFPEEAANLPIPAKTKTWRHRTVCWESMRRSSDSW